MQTRLFSLLTARRFAPFFWTQVSVAFNDNVYKQALVILITFQMIGLSSREIDIYSNLAAGLFILPMFLFSATAGQIGEKYEKARSIRYIKLAEVVLMLLGALAFVLQSIPFMLVVLFLMGLQSTFFGPLKYSVLPQALPRHELVAGNAWVEAGTFLAILGGTILGGWLMAQAGGPFIAGVAVIVFAVLGYLAARAIPELPASAPDLKFNFNPVSETWATLRYLGDNRAIFNSVLGISWFWFYGAVFLAQLPNYTKLILGGGEELAPLVPALFSVGIGLGSLICERLSKGQVEIGLVPIGALGLTVFGIDLYFARPGPSLVEGLNLAGFLAQPGAWRVVVDLFLIGVFGGFYIVPLFALVQSRSAPDRVSRVIAANNVLNAGFMVGAALFAVALFAGGFSVPQVLLTVAILNALVAIYIFTLVPEFVLRFLAYLMINVLYRVRVSGLERIPETGAVLLVCNHVSYVDALLIGGSIPRPTRFVMYHKIYKLPLLNWLFRVAKTIPIASAKEDPEMLARAMDEIDRELAEGQLVLIFPEGGLTEDGELKVFRSGVEKILARRAVPVIPLGLSGLWGSVFSRWHRAAGKIQRPRRLFARVELRVGEVVDAAEAKVERLQQDVLALRPMR